MAISAGPVPRKLAGSLLCICLLCVLCVSVVQSGAPFYPDRANLLVLRGPDGKDEPVRDAAGWARRLAQILAGMQAAMGPLRDESRKGPLDVRITAEVRTPHYTRKRLTYAAEKGDRVPAYLLVPTGRTGRLPAVLCLHQTNGKLGKDEPAGLGGNPNLHYAHHLARRGYVTL